MDKKIISKSRYKKITKSSKLKKDKDFFKSKVKNKKVKKHIDNKVEHVDYSKIKARNDKTSFGITILKMIVSVSILVGIAFLSKYIVKKENRPIISVFSEKTNNISLVPNYEYNIGVNKLGNTDIIKTNNILSNELLKYAKLPIINIKEDYSIDYIIGKNVSKMSDTEYFIELNESAKIKSSDILNTINEIKKTGSENIYYNNVKNIFNMKIENDYKLKIVLSSPDPYYIYSLNFPIYKVDDFSNYNPYTVQNSSGNFIKFIRNDKNTNNLLNSINLTNYEDSDSLVSDFRENKIDMFLTSSYNAMQLIGKHEYNLKKYRSGETIFLFGNKNSELFKQKEVRQALAYAINRDEIIKNASMPISEIIDLPYIYSDVRYKYDTYGANNILLASGWKKNGGIYTKKIEGLSKKIELNLIVNDSDNIKLKIADSIKEMLENIGIRININKLNANDLNNRLQQGNYDIVLSSVYINENPDINYLEQYININEATNKIFEDLKQSEVKDISTNVKKLQDILSQEVACIGILAKDTNVVYQKYITGFENLGYMKIFKNIQNVGKIM